MEVPMRCTNSPHITSLPYGSAEDGPYVLPPNNPYAMKELLQIEFRKKAVESLYVQVGCCAVGWEGVGAD
jgi:hypothetical protein